MKEHLVELFRCPKCSAGFDLIREERENGEIKKGLLSCLSCNTRYPIVNYIPRFVDNDNYARGFGFQWNRHARAQLDRFNGTTISTDRFYSSTRWDRETLKDLKILEAGCGAGRFTEVMLAAGLEVFSVDYSNAVDACLANHGLHPNLHLIQGDIYHLPFEKSQFDRVFCLGVLQHTPDVEKSFHCLVDQLSPGGCIAVDVYPNTLKARLHYPRYVLRPLAKRLPAPFLYKLVVGTVYALLPVSLLLKKIPVLGRYLYPLVPVANYWGTHPLEGEMLREWSIIDTFDWLASWYDQPQTESTVRNWVEKAKLVDAQVIRQGSFVATGRKPERG